MGSIAHDPMTQETPDKTLKTDLTQYSRRRRQDGPYADNLDLDVLIIGGGFGGVYSLHEARKNGLNAVLYEAGQSFGGTWRWVIQGEIPLWKADCADIVDRTSTQEPELTAQFRSTSCLFQRCTRTGTGPPTTQMYAPTTS